MTELAKRVPFSQERLAQLLAVIALLAVLVVLYQIAPNFYRVSNLVNVLQQASIMGLMAIGMTCILITAGIDFSMPANMALSAIIGAIAMRETGSALAGPPVMLLVGTALGLVNAFAVAKLRMVPFVVTLSTMTVVSGLSAWLTRAVSITGIPESFTSFFIARPLGLPVAVWLLIFMAILASYVTQRTVAGRWLYALGLNTKAARVARVRVEMVVAGTYAFAGFMAGLTAIILTARLNSASANMGADSLILDIIASCVIGGVSIFGGVGKVYRAVFGAILLTLLSNAMNLAGVTFYVSLIIKGALIITFVAVERFWRTRV